MIKKILKPIIVVTALSSILYSGCKLQEFNKYIEKLPTIGPQYVTPEYVREIFNLNDLGTNYILNQIGFNELNIKIPFDIKGSELEYKIISNASDLKGPKGIFSFVELEPNFVGLSLPNPDKPEEGILIAGLASPYCDGYGLSAAIGKPFIRDVSSVCSYKTGEYGLKVPVEYLRNNSTKNEDLLLRNSVRILHLIREEVEKGCTPVKIEKF